MSRVKKAKVDQERLFTG